MSYKIKRIPERIQLIQMAGKILASTPDKTVEDIVSLAQHMEKYVYEDIVMTDDETTSTQRDRYAGLYGGIRPVGPGDLGQIQNQPIPYQHGIPQAQQAYDPFDAPQQAPRPGRGL